MGFVLRLLITALTIFGVAYLSDGRLVAVDKFWPTALVAALVLGLVNAIVKPVIKLLTLPMSAEDWRRVFIGSAMDVEIDNASRVLIAPELREWAGLERDVLLVGMGSRFELWDKVRHDAHEATVLAAGMPDVLRDHVM